VATEGAPTADDSAIPDVAESPEPMLQQHGE